MNFAAFLEEAFLKWQNQQGKRKTLAEFAHYLEVKPTTLSNWLGNKRNPDFESVMALAGKLGPDVYDVLGLERPDPDLAFINQHWEQFDPATRRKLRQQAEKFASKNDTERTSQKRRTRTAN